MNYILVETLKTKSYLLLDGVECRSEQETFSNYSDIVVVYYGADSTHKRNFTGWNKR